ncbi:MAG TPA: anthranilate synthase component I [bacterium]|nr:anthranilate synthase component I [bacterium]
MKPHPSALTPSLNQFKKLARDYDRVPVFLTLQSDLETPLSAYLKLGRGKNAFLLESVEKNEQLARYSIVVFDPTEIFEAKDGLLKRRGQGKPSSAPTKNPLADIQRLMGAVRQAPLLEAGFLGGLVGYIGYDAVRYFERLPATKPDVLKIPDLYLMATDKLLLFDHLKRTLRVVVNVAVNPRVRPEKAYARAVGEISRLARELAKPLRGAAEIPVPPAPATAPGDLFGFKSNSDPKAFGRMVEDSKEFIKAGDIIQVVGSQRFEKRVATDAVTVYRVLRRLNPSPYMFLLKMEGVELVGSSPEMFIKVQKGLVETRPIAGSRPRGATPAEDLALEEDLLKDEKELAEHVMLVDLARNDLGRVCEFGSVRVPQFKRVERYSHIMHIVSDVTGRLAAGKTAFDAFQSCFPAGTLSGAPKIRAMEIIEGLEPSRRGIYGGAVAAFGYDGNMDSAITIRSAVLKPAGKGKLAAYVQAGAGLVADSVPQSEYLESCNKARAVLLALHQAEQLGGPARKGGPGKGVRS